MVKLEIKLSGNYNVMLTHLLAIKNTILNPKETQCFFKLKKLQKTNSLQATIFII